MAGLFLCLWMLVDLIFIRSAPPELRKAQWATTIVILLHYLTVAVVLESLVAAMDHQARQTP